MGDGEQENSGILVAAIRANPATPVYDSNGDYYIDPNRSTAPNPVSLLDIVDKTTKDRILGSAFIVVKPVEGLELKVNLGADRKFQKRSNYLPKLPWRDSVTTVLRILVRKTVVITSWN